MTRRPSRAALALPTLVAAALLTACQPRPEPPPAPDAPVPAPSTPVPPKAGEAAAATPAPVVQAAAPREPEARPPEGPKMTPRRVPLDEGCNAEIGRPAAARLVERCIRVSPATHPPCNAENPCEMIQEEIDRGCAMWAETDQPTPKECAA